MEIRNPSCPLVPFTLEVRFRSYNKLYFAFTIPLSSFLVLNLNSIVFINTCMTCMVLELACNSCPGICIKGVCKAGIQSQGTSYPWRNGHWWAQIGTFFVMLLIVYIKKIHHREARQTKFWNGAQLFSLVFMYIITWLMIRKLGLVFRLLKLTIWLLSIGNTWENANYYYLKMKSKYHYFLKRAMRRYQYTALILKRLIKIVIFTKTVQCLQQIEKLN